MGLISRVSSRTYREDQVCCAEPLETSLLAPAGVRTASSEWSRRWLARCWTSGAGASSTRTTMLIRDMARKWFETEVRPHHGDCEKTGVVPREVGENAGENGLLGCQTSDEYGGIGADVLHAAIVWEEQSYSNCTGPGFALHSDICMPYIENYGSEDQKNHYLPLMTAGKCISAIAMTEPGAGSDLQGIKTHAKRDGDDWILNGSKTFITNGQNADLTIVVAITNPEAKSAAHGISLFLVEDTAEGFKKGTNLSKLGMEAQDTSELFFEDIRLPMSSIIGGEKGLNKGFMMLMSELPQERLLIGAMSMASREFLYETTRD